MIFGGEMDGYQKRYSSLTDAIKGHNEEIKIVSGSVT
jgi:hypothetical protein